MTTLYESAWAKLNLSLDVGQKRPDGYHDMRLLMQSISLCDHLTLHLDAGRWRAEAGEQLPHDEKNLALRAARAFYDASGIPSDGVEIRIDKQIPTCAGLGGGSADAAAVLRALQRYYHNPLGREQLLQIAAQIGSDVPFCVMGGTMLATGRGEILTPLEPLPMCEFLLCKPTFASPTPELFRALDQNPPTHRPDFDRLIEHMPDLKIFASEMENVFEPLLTKQHPELAQIRRALMECGAIGAMLTGTGSALFGIFTDSEAVSCAEKRLSELVPWVSRANPIQTV